MKITADNSIINQIQQALETSSIGVAFKEKYNITISATSIEFQTKTSHQLCDPLDFFWLGWFAKEYE